MSPVFPKTSALIVPPHAEQWQSVYSCLRWWKITDVPSEGHLPPEESFDNKREDSLPFPIILATAYELH